MPIRKHPCVPMANIFSTRHWTTGEFQYDAKSTPLLRTALHNRAIELLDLSMKELYEHYCRVEPNNLLFNAPLGNISSYYYTVAESVEKMEQLLLYQFNEDTELVHLFLEDLYNVIDKRLAKKKNSMFVLSEPNGGKNWFFDAVILFFLNFGRRSGKHGRSNGSNSGTTT